MPDNDRWEDDPYETERYEDRDRAPRRHDGPYYADRGFGRAPRIGPTGMMSSAATGNFGTSGRYFEDMAGRASYEGFSGGVPGYGPARRFTRPGLEPPGGREPTPGRERIGRRELEDVERDVGGPYTDYGRAAGGYGAGGGYTPAPYEGVPHEPRSWADRGGDEVRSWFGDHAAERRREWDAAAGEHRGRGPKGYKRSDERIREDVSDRLTDDPLLDASDIELTVAGGEVTLNGTVTSRFAKRRAEDCADAVSGVGHVQNNLRVNAAPRPGSVGAQTDPRIAAVSEGRDADEAARDLAEERIAPDHPHAPR